MRRVVMLGMIILIPMCCLCVVFFDGYYLPYKPCRPITYPDGKRITNALIYKTEDDYSKVIDFFTQRLSAKKPLLADINEWRVEKLSDSETLFSCYSVDINFLTTETGCIYVYDQDQQVTIETSLIRSEGANAPCK
jgi:hypothetical protein